MNPSIEEALFQLALAKPAEQRAAFLEALCEGNAALHQRLEALLAAHERPETMLDAQAEAVRLRAGASSFARISEDASAKQFRPGIKLDFAGEPPDEAVGQTLGRYRLLEKVGEGGCGVVYVAEQTEPVRRRVALKVIKLGMDTRQVVARFEAERQALAMMDHPNIARVLDAGTTDTGRPYFVMELVRGMKITDYCDQNHLSTKDRLDLFIKVCHAIQHAHQKGIIHRDIKPSNILVTLHDGVPVPKVIDFGIAKATEGRLTDATVYTQLHQFIGTPAYMSPEQAEMSGLDIDTRSDIYSLGVLLYELLAGSTPFDSKELMASGLDAMRKTIREKEPQRPSTRLATLGADQLTTAARRRSADTSKLLHQLKGDLDWIVMKCLEKDRQRRYETANGLAADLKRHLANEPVAARPPSSGYRLQKAFRRHRLSFVAAGAVAAALVIGFGVSTWQMVEARKARGAEREQRLASQAAQRRAENAQAAEKEERLRADAEKLTAQRHLYAANMNLAQQAWEQPNLVRLQQILEETEASPFRGFEWYYWQLQSHLAEMTLQSHLEGVHAVAFSGDGQRLVTGGGDHTAKVWEIATGRELLTLKGHTAEIWSAAFFPDGRRMITGGTDQTARVWDAVSGRELLILGGHAYRIYGVAVSPDGQRIATPSGSHLKIWNASDGRELLTITGHVATINSVDFSRDGRRLLTGSGDRTAKVWDVETGAPLLTLTGHRRTIRSVAFSPDGQRIVTGSDDQTAKVWEVATGRELHTLQGHRAGIQKVDVSSDGQQVVTGSDDYTAKVWDLATGRDLHTIKGHRSGVSSVAFSPDGRRVVTGSFDGTARVWEVAIDRNGLPLKGHTAAINAWAFSPDLQRLVTASDDHTARVWEVASGRELLAFKRHTGLVRAVAFSSDGQRVVTGSHDQTVRLWEAATGRELLTLQGLGASILAVAFSPDGLRLVAGAGEVAKVWEVSSGRELLTLQGHRGQILSVAFSPDGHRVVAAGGGDFDAKVWDATSGRELLVLQGHAATIWSVAFSPDGRWIVTGSGDETARLWDAASGRELRTFQGHGGRVKAVAFSPDGQRIVTGSSDQTVRVWGTASGWELLVLRGHEGGVDSVAFSPDGQRMVTGSDDRTVWRWSAASPGQVASWQREEREAGQRLAALERERSAERDREELARAADPGALKRWRILAPIPLATGQSGAQALEVEQIPGEALLRPGADEACAVAGIDSRWQDVVSDGSRLDLYRHLGRETLNSVAYAVCYIRSETNRVGLRMLVGSTSAATVFLNGKRVHQCQRRIIQTDQDTVPDIALHAGLNAIVFKLVTENDTSRGWWGSIRFTDAAGQPVQGIEVTLDPDPAAKGEP